MVLDDIALRTAASTDSEQVAEIYLESRKAFLGFAPLVHSDDAVRKWIMDDLVSSGGVRVAAARGSLVLLVGMMALSREADVGWINQLYPRPSIL